MDENEIKKQFEESDVIFVSDYFVGEYSGGAELSTDALFKSSPLKVFQLKSLYLNENVISAGIQKTWVFFNFSQLNFELLPLIIQNCNYFIVEYDYKFCKFRSIELHKVKTGKECDCHNEQSGKIASAFFAGAQHIFWMSEKQKEIYKKRFSFLEEDKMTVLSSIFDVGDLEFIERLRGSRKEDQVKEKYALINSNSWIKGVKDSMCWLRDNDIDYDLVGGLSYHDLLKKLSSYKGLVFKPLGGDTCPRIVIEAKLLGLDLLINENVQHSTEDWWDLDIDGIESYILDGHNRFWDQIMQFYNRPVKLSGYTTAYNVMNSDYPWRESITSLLGFCDEVIVLDGGSSDGTYKELLKMSENESRLVVNQIKRDWENPRFALYDGQQKAAARTLCTGDWCWQMDIDEIVHEEDYAKIKKLIRQLPKTAKLISLPVVEYWGGSEKVRVDVNPWKWRLSKNDPHITHGVPADHRSYDDEGNLFSTGSDGCDYIRIDNYQKIPDINFYTPALHQVRIESLNNNKDALKSYEDYINLVAEQLPGVHHYSWFDIKRKIYSYKNYWSKHWSSIYNKAIDDIPENNMFFDKKWVDVSDDEINDLSIKMGEELGGWIFHTRVDFDKPTPWIEISLEHPSVMNDWLSKREK